jgi:hypothetical protein
MRLWTIHPKYLDRMGLIALWREGLLAQKVLSGKTSGYRHHPQLQRFREQSSPVDASACFLGHVYAESVIRGYTFDAGKIPDFCFKVMIDETDSQLEYEWKLLLYKIKKRDAAQYKICSAVKRPDCNPIFNIVPGGVRPWEKVKIFD